MEKDQIDKNIGKKLDGRYEITEHIGEGGMADVYRATDIVDHKTVAVKILKKEFSENEEFLRRFRNESKAIALLNHPDIVKILDVGFSDRIQFIVMEYIDGITLNEYMEENKVLEWQDAVHFTIHILRALQHAHSKGIVHRDIKPQNIMIYGDDGVKVMDFGIAKFAREEGKTSTDKAIGTVHYISPEQARGATTDAKSDIYSVGVMLYEMLTGKKPFDTDNPVSIAVMHMQAEVPLPHLVRPGIPTGLEEIILKAMQKDPADRYQSAREMMDDIQTFKENPDEVFGYFPELLGGKSATANEKTRAYSPVAVPQNAMIEENSYDEPAPQKGKRGEEPDDEDYDEDDEYEEEEPKSLFVPILSAVIIVVIVVAAVMFTTVVLNVIKNNRGATTAEQFAMPNLINMDYQEAQLLYGDQININVESREYSDYEKDKIFDQDIAPENPVSKGEQVNVKVSLGAKQVKMPDVTGWDFETAKTTIINAGLNVEPRYTYDDEIEAGKVISTDPAGPAELEPGSYVIIYISRGENLDTVPMPNFVGLDWEHAQSMAEELGLVLQKEDDNDTAEEGTVLHQSIEPDEEVTEGTMVTLTVSTGVPDPKDVRVNFSIPANATGVFQITFYEDGIEKFAGPEFNVAYTMGATSVTVSGTGVVDYFVNLKNTATGATAEIGTYRVDYEAGTAVAISSDLLGAFTKVGGIGELTTTTTAVETTTLSTSTTAKTWWTPPSQSSVSTTTTTVAP